MPVEIERKFLVLNDDWRLHAVRRESIVQGYLANTDKCSIRVRTAGDKADVNVKSMTIDVVRSEFEYAVPMDEAKAMLETLCILPLIGKTRHYVPHRGYTWEVDDFDGDNAGLIIAEIELSDSNENFPRPPWLGREISDDPRYFNICLVERPYSTWQDVE